MCRNIIIILLCLVILLGAGCGILAFRYNRLESRASEQAERIGGLADDVTGYRTELERIGGELEDERIRADRLARGLEHATAENLRIADKLDGVTRGVAEGRDGVERITESEKRTAEKYDELEEYLNRYR